MSRAERADRKDNEADQQAYRMNEGPSGNVLTPELASM